MVQEISQNGLGFYCPSCTKNCASNDHALQLVALASRPYLNPEEFQEAKLCICCRSHLRRVHDNVGRNLLHIAVVFGNTKLFRLLLQDEKMLSLVKARDTESGWTPLHYAVFYGNFACAKYLLKAGCGKLEMDNNGINSVQMCAYDSTRLANETAVDIPDNNSTIPATTNAVNTPPSYLGWYDINEKRSNTVTWGQNKNFTLGLGTDQEKPVPDTSIAQARGAEDEMLDVVMCKYHALFLLRNGLVYGVGNGAGGRLGETSGVLLRLSEIKLPCNNSIIQIAVGKDHSVFLSQSGQVWACGTNTYYQLGLSSSSLARIATAESVTTPRMVTFSSSSATTASSSTVSSRPIRLIKAERFHTLFASDQTLYVAGLNVGQFGPSVGGNVQTHSKADHHHSNISQYIFAVPTELTCFSSNNSTRHFPLKSIACSDAAVLLHTHDDALLLLHNFKLKRLPNGPARDAVPEEIGVFGGRINTRLNANALHYENADSDVKSSELIIIGLYNCEHSVMSKQLSAVADGTIDADDVEYNNNHASTTGADHLPRSLTKHFGYQTSFQQNQHRKLPAARQKTALPRAMAEVVNRRELFCLKRTAPRQYQWVQIRFAGQVPHEFSYVKTFRIGFGKLIFADIYGQVYVATFEPKQFALFQSGTSKATAAAATAASSSNSQSSSSKIVPASSAQRYLTTSHDAAGKLPTLVMHATRVVHLQGAIRVFCEPSGKNFAAIQRLPTITLRPECYTSVKGAMFQHSLCNERALRRALQQLYEERSFSGDITITLPSQQQQQCWRVHGFVLFARSVVLQTEFLWTDNDSNDNNYGETTTTFIKLNCTLPVGEPAQQALVMEDFIQYLYYHSPLSRAATATAAAVAVETVVLSKNARRRCLDTLCSKYGISKDWLNATDAVKERGTSLAHIGWGFVDAWQLQPDSTIICEHASKSEAHENLDKLPCHRVMLMARSKYFSAMFKPGYWQEDAAAAAAGGDIDDIDIPEPSFALSASAASADVPVVSACSRKMKSNFSLPCTVSVGELFLRWIYCGQLVAADGDIINTSSTNAENSDDNDDDADDNAKKTIQSSPKHQRPHSKKELKKQQRDRLTNMRSQLYSIDVQDLCGLLSLADFVLMPELKHAVEPLLVLHIDFSSAATLIKFSQQTNASLVYRYGHYYLAQAMRFVLDGATGTSDSLETLEDGVLDFAGQIYNNSNCLRTSVDETHVQMQPILKRSDFRQVSAVDEMYGINYNQLLSNVRHWLNQRNNNNNSSTTDNNAAAEMPTLYSAESENAENVVALSEAERRKIVAWWNAAAAGVKVRRSTASEDDASNNSPMPPSAERKSGNSSKAATETNVHVEKTKLVQSDVPHTGTTIATHTAATVQKTPPKPAYLKKYENLIRSEEARLQSSEKAGMYAASEAPPVFIPKQQNDAVLSQSQLPAATDTSDAGINNNNLRAKNVWQKATPLAAAATETLRLLPSQQPQQRQPLQQNISNNNNSGSSFSHIMQQEENARKQKHNALQAQLAQAAAAAERLQQRKSTPWNMKPSGNAWAAASASSVNSAYTPPSPLTTPTVLALSVSPGGKLPVMHTAQPVRARQMSNLTATRPSIYADGGGDEVPANNNIPPKPVATIAFNAVQQSELRAIDAADRQSRQAFALVEIEERAIQELRALYGVEECAEEFILVGRARSQVVPAQPHWK